MRQDFRSGDGGRGLALRALPDLGQVGGRDDRAAVDDEQQPLSDRGANA